MPTRRVCQYRLTADLCLDPECTGDHSHCQLSDDLIRTPEKTPSSSEVLSPSKELAQRLSSLIRKSSKKAAPPPKKLSCQKTARKLFESEKSECTRITILPLHVLVHIWDNCTGDDLCSLAMVSRKIRQSILQTGVGTAEFKAKVHRMVQHRSKLSFRNACIENGAVVFSPFVDSIDDTVDHGTLVSCSIPNSRNRMLVLDKVYFAAKFGLDPSPVFAGHFVCNGTFTRITVQVESCPFPSFQSELQMTVSDACTYALCHRNNQAILLPWPMEGYRDALFPLWIPCKSFFTSRTLDVHWGAYVMQICDIDQGTVLALHTWKETGDETDEHQWLCIWKATPVEDQKPMLHWVLEYATPVLSEDDSSNTYWRLRGTSSVLKCKYDSSHDAGTPGLRVEIHQADLSAENPSFELVVDNTYHAESTIIMNSLWVRNIQKVCEVCLVVIRDCTGVLSTYQIGPSAGFVERAAFPKYSCSSIASDDDMFVVAHGELNWVDLNNGEIASSIPTCGLIDDTDAIEVNCDWGSQTICLGVYHSSSRYVLFNFCQPS